MGHHLPEQKEIVMRRKKHNYEYSVDTASASAPANVVRLVGVNKRVLEVGCGPGSITKVLFEQNRCRVTGVEIDADAIDRVRPYCDQVIRADLNSSNWPELINALEKFEVVVAADVLEHLYDPWSNLKKIASFIAPDGYAVISLPHAGHASVISCLLNGDFQYRDWGLLDRTHIRFFCLKNIEDLFSAAGLKIVDVRYVIATPEATEFANSWSRLSNDQKAAINKAPHSNVYQVVIKAVALESEGDVVPLIPPFSQFSVNMPSLRFRLGAWMGPVWRARIHKLIHFFGIRI